MNHKPSLQTSRLPQLPGLQQPLGCQAQWQPGVKGHLLTRPATGRHHLNYECWLCKEAKTGAKETKHHLGKVFPVHVDCKRTLPELRTTGDALVFRPDFITKTRPCLQLPVRFAKLVGFWQHSCCLMSQHVVSWTQTPAKIPHHKYLCSLSFLHDPVKRGETDGLNQQSTTTSQGRYPRPEHSMGSPALEFHSWEWQLCPGGCRAHLAQKSLNPAGISSPQQPQVGAFWSGIAQSWAR